MSTHYCTAFSLRCYCQRPLRLMLTISVVEIGAFGVEVLSRRGKAKRGPIVMVPRGLCVASWKTKRGCS